MQLGMVGLGRMGSNMVRRLMRSGHECIVYDVSEAAVDAVSRRRGQPRLRHSRISWRSSRRRGESG